MSDLPDEVIEFDVENPSISKFLDSVKELLTDDDETDAKQSYLALRSSLIGLTPKAKLQVTNQTGSTVWVKVSKSCGGGQDGYWEIPPGGTEPWKRCVYRRVTLKASTIAHSDSGIFASYDHIMAVSTACNHLVITHQGFSVKAPPPSCL